MQILPQLQVLREAHLYVGYGEDTQVTIGTTANKGMGATP